jgi:hypothetical protein
MAPQRKPWLKPNLNQAFEFSKQANAMTPSTFLLVRSALRPFCFSLMLLLNLNNVLAQANACLTAQQVKAENLYGQWSVEFTAPPRGLPAKATLQLQRHAEYTESLAGTLLRDFSAAPSGKVPGHSPRAQVAGDLEGDLLLLDESSNGINLTASWDGKVVDGSCGQTIQGVWKDLSSDAPENAANVPFTLRQINAW